jgi:hypothetical protein
VAEVFVDELPQRLTGDLAYDSDPLDEVLEEHGIEMIAPHRRNRKKPKTQDGRACGVINDGGRSNVCLPGCIIFGGLLLGTNVNWKIISDLFISDASEFYSGLFEMTFS